MLKQQPNYPFGLKLQNISVLWTDIENVAWY